MSGRELYFEDFAVGDRFESGAATLTEEDILAFARRWDPQVFHVDPVAAKSTLYGGLIASGLHTIVLAFRLFLDTGAFAAASLGSPGIDEVRWRKPVRPGDTLHVVGEVREVIPSRSKPDRGIVRILYMVLNDRGETVMTMIGNQLVRRRAGPTG